MGDRNLSCALADTYFRKHVVGLGAVGDEHLVRSLLRSKVGIVDETESPKSSMRLFCKGVAVRRSF